MEILAKAPVNTIHICLAVSEIGYNNDSSYAISFQATLPKSRLQHDAEQTADCSLHGRQARGIGTRSLHLIDVFDRVLPHSGVHGFQHGLEAIAACQAPTSPTDPKQGP